MILSSHLCLLTDGELGRFPVVRIGCGSSIESLELCPDGPEEIGGMVFRGGVMVCGLPSDAVSFNFLNRDDFAEKMRPYAVAVGAGPVAVLSGGDLNTFSGAFTVWRPATKLFR